MGRRAGGVDVVDEHDGGRRARGRERSAHVRPALGERETALSSSPTRAGEERDHGDVPTGAELPRERLRRVVAAAAATLGIRRDEDERLAVVLERLGGHDRCGRGEVPKAPILPRVDEAANGLVVDHRRAGTRESQAPTCALEAAPDRPGGRRTAPLAAGAAKPRQRAEAGAAYLHARKPARDAALRQEEVEQDRGHGPTV